LEQATYFRAVWDDPGLLQPCERVTLAGLAELQIEAEQWVNRPEVDAHLQAYLDQDQIERAWQLLQGRDMVDEDGRQRRFTVELVRRWVRKFKPLAEMAAREKG